MNLCKDCGAENEPELTFCEMCGAPIEAATPERPAADQPPQGIPEQPPPITQEPPPAITSQPPPVIPGQPPPMMPDQLQQTGPDQPPPLTQGQPPQPDAGFCRNCRRPVRENEKCPHCKASVPVWLVTVLFVAMFMSVIVSAAMSIAVGMFLSAGSLAVSIRNCVVRKKAVDIICIVLASILLFINLCLLLVFFTPPPGR